MVKKVNWLSNKLLNFFYLICRPRSCPRLTRGGYPKLFVEEGELPKIPKNEKFLWKVKRIYGKGRNIAKTGRVASLAGTSLKAMTAPMFKSCFKRWARFLKDYKVDECFPGAGDKGEIPSNLSKAVKGYGKTYHYSLGRAQTGE